MVKINDIANATGYSKTTVSKALNNYSDISQKAKDIIVATAKEMDYIPNAQARGLVMKRSFIIGVILDEMLNLGLAHPFFAGIIQSFRASVESRGYSMVMIAKQIGNSNVRSYYDHCKQLNVDGVFVLCSSVSDPNIQELVNSNIPTVFLDNPGEKSHCILSNHYQGAVEAIDYLVQMKHIKIAHIFGNELTFAGAERKRGYYDALKKHKIPIRDDYVLSGGYFSFKYGKKAMAELLDLKDPPTAVFVAGDVMALGAIQACYEKRIQVPEDISIIGFDNVSFLDWITPSLTTVDQDFVKLGEACCDVLIRAIANKKLPIIHQVIPTSIVERKSCIPPK